MTYTEPKLDDCKTLIDRMASRFGKGSPSVWEVIDTREQHYYQTVEADPPMLTGYESHVWQSSILRDTWTKYRARLVENPWTPQLSAPRPSAAMDAVAADAEMYLQWMFDELKARTGDDIQGLLADGMGIYNYGVLHAYLADDDLNGKSADMDFEEVDDLPDDPAEAKRFAPVEDDATEENGKKKSKAYRETADSLMQRRDHVRALAKPPWKLKAYHPRNCAWIEDESLIGGFRYFLTSEVIRVADWFGDEPLKREDVTERAAPTDIDVHGIASNWRPTAQQMEKDVKLYRLWSREWVCEIVDGLDGPEGTDFRCIPNRVKRVPFWLAPGMITLNNDPVFRFEPLLTSIYRIKPIRDRYMANMSVLAESAAIPRYWCVPISDKNLPPLADETGHVKVFGANAIEALTPPDGYKYERIGGDGTTGQYERLREVFDAEMARALPDTGVGDIKDSTQPWTARIMQQVGNIVPSMSIDHLIWCLLPMVKMIVEVNADPDNGPGDLAFYPKEGKSLIKLSPKDWEGLRADVTIDKISAVERTTAMQAGLEYVAQGAWTWLDWIEKAEGEADPQRTFVKRETFKYWQANVLQLQLKEGAAKAMGSKYSQNPVAKAGDPPFVNGAGMGVMPQEILQKAGMQSMNPQPPPQGMQGGGGMPVPPQGTQMGNMPTLNAPGVAPQQGLVG